MPPTVVVLVTSKQIAMAIIGVLQLIPNWGTSSSNALVKRAKGPVQTAEREPTKGSTTAQSVPRQHIDSLPQSVEPGLQP